MGDTVDGPAIEAIHRRIVFGKGHLECLVRRGCGCTRFGKVRNSIGKAKARSTVLRYCLRIPTIPFRGGDHRRLYLP